MRKLSSVLTPPATRRKAEITALTGRQPDPARDGQEVDTGCSNSDRRIPPTRLNVALNAVGGQPGSGGGGGLQMEGKRGEAQSKVQLDERLKYPLVPMSSTSIFDLSNLIL